MAGRPDRHGPTKFATGANGHRLASVSGAHPMAQQSSTCTGFREAATCVTLAAPTLMPGSVSSPMTARATVSPTESRVGPALTPPRTSPPSPTTWESPGSPSWECRRAVSTPLRLRPGCPTGCSGVSASRPSRRIEGRVSTSSQGWMTTLPRRFALSRAETARRSKQTPRQPQRGCRAISRDSASRDRSPTC